MSPGTFSQTHVSVCALSDGSSVVTWQDDREGAFKIFLQRYSDLGVALGTNALAAGRADGFNLIEPEVAATVSNRFYLAYRDESAGRILCVRLNADFSVDLPEFEIGDPDPSIYSGPFALAARPSGELLVAYEAHGGGNVIRARRFSVDGIGVGAALTVNSDSPSVSHWAPAASYGEAGAFAVAWEDYRSGTADIFLRRFDATGMALAAEDNLIDAASRGRDQYIPDLVYSSIHGYLSAWTDSRDSGGIFLQRFGNPPGAGLVGANRELSRGATDEFYQNVALATDVNGLLTAAYCAYSFSDRTLAIRFDGSLNPIGSPVTVNSLLNGQPDAPALAISSAGRISVCWSETALGLENVLYALHGGGLAPITGSELRTHDDGSGAVSDQVSLAVVPGLRVLSAFHDQRNDGGDVFVQASDLAQTLTGANQRANQDAAGGRQSEPSIAANSDNFLVAWLDERALGGVTGTRVFIRYGDRFGAFDSDELQLSGTVVSPKASPAAALGPDNAGLVAWIDFRQGAPGIFGQFLRSDRSPLFSELPITTATPGIERSQLTVEVDSLSRFRVLWLERGGAVAAIQSKAYGPSGAALGSTSFVSDQPNVTLIEFDAAVDSAGAVYLLWRGVEPDGTRRLFLSALDFSGSPLAQTLEVTDDLAAGPSDPTVSVDGEGFVLTAWIDRRGPTRRLFQQLYSPSFLPQGSNQPVSLAGVPAMFEPVTLASRGRSWFGWVDARSEGMNVYLTGFVHSQTDVVDGNGVFLPNTFVLDQNYPNPFNPSTKISFTITARDRVSLEVYNMAGRKVRILVNQDLPAGAHIVEWDGRDDTGESVASGIYLYRLMAGKRSAARKMTLLK
ncbi:MAG: FlgD immunoglobulin-like domain containing protein [Candidatus Zixiibacteriota bacterium]